jgi:hypothetical protein
VLAGECGLYSGELLEGPAGIDSALCGFQCQASAGDTLVEIADAELGCGDVRVNSGDLLVVGFVREGIRRYPSRLIDRSSPVLISRKMAVRLIPSTGRVRQLILSSSPFSFGRPVGEMDSLPAIRR